MKRILSQSYLSSFVGIAKLRNPANKLLKYIINFQLLGLRQDKHNQPISYNNQQPPKY